MRGCAAEAINIAQSIGMNRWLAATLCTLKTDTERSYRDQYPKNDPILRGVWKRLWWGCTVRVFISSSSILSLNFLQVRDAMVATAHGLPLILRLSESDIYPLTHDEPGES